ncbi:MAG: hypothetical protein K9K75_06970 [Deltaproteobacteria bacterium]|nr:hypothetical protein [Deltaproteobacteria bacterium]
MEPKIAMDELLQRAWDYYGSGKMEESIACFEALFARELAESVFTGFAFDELVRIYQERKNWAELIRVCEQAVAKVPDDHHLLKTLTEAYLKAESIEKALTSSVQLVTNDGENPSHHLLYAQAHVANGNLTAAHEAFHGAFALEPQAGTAFLFSQLLAKYGYREPAEAKLRQAITLDPSNTHYPCALGDMLIEQGKTEEAIGLYYHAAENSPNADGYLYRLALSLKKRGFLREAVTSLEKARVINNTEKRYLLLLAEIYCDLQEFKVAHSLLDAEH